jgi:hypothetical protein
MPTWYVNMKPENLNVNCSGLFGIPVVATVAIVVMIQLSAIPPALLPVTFTKSCVIGLPVGEESRSSIFPIANRRAIT